MNEPQEFGPAAKRELWRHMRVPAFSFVALLVFLAAIITTGQLFPSSAGSWIIVGLTVCMAITVVLFSMEIREEAPLTRFFSVLGFAWVAILFGMTLVDYLTR